MPASDPRLTAAGASWDDGPDAGLWIVDRLAEFGASVGHAVPLGYEAYAVVRLTRSHGDGADGGDENQAALTNLDALLDVLAPFTGDQPVHVGLWDGWGYLYGPGEDPRLAPGMGYAIAVPPPRLLRGPNRKGPLRLLGPVARLIRRQRVNAGLSGRDWMAAQRVQRPDAEPLELPHRRYHLWTGPLRSATALRQWPDTPPSLIWPEDRSWFVGVPIYSNEAAVAGTTALVDAVLRDPRLNARRAKPDDLLDIDD